ncbi:hypothetical protein [Halodurantibacterium flavum]|uniref:Uncharacterized protein n=1 Tax=Halodurantibacterium flavum TaxID=1382802 RepID=A0ABW4S9U5_9RHOB
MKWLLLALWVLLPFAASAGPLSDTLFRTGDMTAALPLRFAHEDDGTLGELTLSAPDAEGRMTLSHSVDDRTRPLGALPAEGGNPALLFFLETVVRRMAEETGGSPFYIRNRIREALVADTTPLPEPLPAGRTEIVVAPFANDPNRDRMGWFADLRLGFTLDEAAPLPLVRLSADTGAGAGGYHSSLTLIAEDR